MSETQTLPKVPRAGDDDWDEVDHLYCCDPDLSLCGIDISRWDDMGDAELSSERPCVVCAELDTRACERCGA